MSNDAPATLEKSVHRPSFHQRQYIVDKPFQYRLIATLMAVWFANSLFFSLVLYFLYDGHLNQFYDLVPREGMLPLLSLPALIVTAMAFVAVFGVIVLALVTLYMSNQIAGPLYRAKKSLERVGRGEWGFELQFRHSDFLNDFPPIFNKMVDGIRQRGLAELEELKAIEASASDAAMVKVRARKLRETKEAQLGLGHGDAHEAEEREQIPVAVH